MDTDTPMDDSARISTLPARLNAHIDELSTALAPALARGSWADAVEPVGDADDAVSPLARAKLDVALAYTLVDLVWVYLQTRGIDPRTHPVSAELERVRGYYAKIRAIETPEQRRTKVDVPAAGRFIAHSIPKSQRLGVGADSPAADLPNLPSSSAEGAARAGRQRAAKEQKQKQKQTKQNGDTPVPVPSPALAHVGRSSRFLKSIAPTAERVVPGSALAGSSAGNPIEYDDDDDDDADDDGDGDVVLAGPSGASDVLMFSGDEEEEEEEEPVLLHADVDAEAEALWAEMQADIGAELGAGAGAQRSGSTDQSEDSATPTPTSGVGGSGSGSGSGAGQPGTGRQKPRRKHKRKRD